MTTVTYGTGIKDDPWTLQTPPLSSSYQAYLDDDMQTIEVQVGKTKLSYRLRAIEDLAAMLQGKDWVPLGNADEGKPVLANSVEAWARSDDNPVAGYYGIRKGYRGRFANYVCPILEVLGLAELEHNKRNNRVRAAQK